MAPLTTPLVLIADDSAVVRLTVARRVRAAGLDVVERESVASVSTLDTSALACALLDFDLGDGFGTEIATTLRASREALPIAFFTSETTQDVVDRAAAFGPVFKKPDELDAAIAWLEKNARRSA